MSDGSHPTLICLTPVRNEAWILERTLKCASQWADFIVVADQCSQDETRAIAARFPKVILIENDSSAYDEGARQRLLLEAGRRIPVQGRRIFLAIDADEMLTANWSASAEWQQILNADSGTVLLFEWVNIQPGLTTCWIKPEDVPYGFVDDGSHHTGNRIHSRRLPAPEGAPAIHCREIKLLHYEFTAWDRMRSKQRWYQCWERLNHPNKRAIQIYRQYNFMNAFPDDELVPVKPEWMSGYERNGIDMTTITSEPQTWWDAEIVKLFSEYGTGWFRKLAIWDADWAEIALRLNCGAPAGSFKDPRNALDKLVHRWLANTQSRSQDPKIRWAQRLLRILGW